MSVQDVVALTSAHNDSTLIHKAGQFILYPYPISYTYIGKSIA